MNYPSYEDAKSIVIKEGINSQAEYKSRYKELGLPANPDIYYKDKGWEGWTSFRGKEYPTFEEAHRRVIEKGIKNKKEYAARHEELGLPSNPYCFYRGKGWVDWYYFWGDENKSFTPYEEAHRRVVVAGIKSGEEYKVRCKELGLQRHPERCYKGKGWVDWDEFLGKEGEKSYEEAHRIVIEVGIKRGEDYRAKCKELGLPSHPDRCYKDKGWVDWPTFWGKSHKVSHKERRTKVLSRLSLDPILLDDKAPLQVLYMVASCVDKDLAREIETLLDSTTPEDRLNWVKEQLKDVKEETTSRDGTTSASPDEVSAMESMMDVFEDTFDDLSEEDSTNIKTILENYYHNVINKELIAEYDD